MLLISYKTSISNLSSFYGKISTPTRCYFVSHFKATTSAHIRSPQLSLHHTPTPTHTHTHTHTRTQPQPRPGQDTSSCKGKDTHTHTHTHTTNTHTYMDRESVVQRK